MKELALLSATGANAPRVPGRPEADSDFDELLSKTSASSPHAPTAPVPGKVSAFPPVTDEAPEVPRTRAGPPPARLERETVPARTRARRPGTGESKSEFEAEDRRRRARPTASGVDGSPQPAFAQQGPHLARSAQASSALRLKDPGATQGVGGTATKVTTQITEPLGRKPSAPETGEFPSHRSEAPPLSGNPSPPPDVKAVADAAVPPPPLPSPVALAALDLPSLHLAILPNVARLSVSTEDGDARVQLKVKDSVANVRVEGPGAAAFQRAPDELRLLLAQAGLSLGSFDMGHGGGQQHEGREFVAPYETEVTAGFVTSKAPEPNGTEGEKVHPRHVRVRA